MATLLTDTQLGVAVGLFHGGLLPVANGLAFRACLRVFRPLVYGPLFAQFLVLVPVSVYLLLVLLPQPWVSHWPSYLRAWLVAFAVAGMVASVARRRLEADP
jgi:hypothetical protein